MDYITTASSPVGTLTLRSDGQALTGLWMEGQKYFPAFSDDVSNRDDLPVFIAAKEWLRSYFAGEQPEVRIPLAPRGSEFQQSVWAILQTIPYGQTITYGEIARRLGQLQGRRIVAQAVGGAVGRNPIAVLIPCHRVVGTNGNLTGYAGGLERKTILLALEKINENYYHLSLDK